LGDGGLLPGGPEWGLLVKGNPQMAGYQTRKLPGIKPADRGIIGHRYLIILSVGVVAA